MKIYFFVLLLSLSLLITGCQSDFGVDHRGMEAWIQTHATTALDSDGLSQNSIDFLLREGLFDNYSDNSEKTLESLSVKLVDTKNRRLLSVLIELTYLQAKRTPDRDRANYYYLSSCIYAYAYLFKDNFEKSPSPFEPAFLFACRFYNYSAAEVFQYMDDKNLLSSGNINMPFLNGFVKFLPPVNQLPRDLDQYSSFKVCYEYSSFGFHSLTRQSGLGVPLIAVGDLDLKKKQGQIMDASTVAYPATVFIKFDSLEKGKYNASMEYYDSMKTNSIDVQEHNVPLEIDLSTYLGHLLRGGATYNPITVMMDTSLMNKKKGLYTLSPYDKNKIPVVFIHGVLSMPRTWVQTINTLLQNPKIRKNYQFWLFAYPSGNPVLYSAANLRKNLLKAETQFNPDGKNPKFNQMIIVGHSMGGLLAKSMIQNSGDRLLNELTSGKSLDDFDLTDKEKIFLKKMVIYKRLPFIDRVIFISTPHRGSTMTRWWVASLAAKLVSLPKQLASDIYDVQKKLFAGSKEPLKISTGVDNLDPDNMFVKVSANIPIDKNVPYHSIIGNNEKAGVPGGTDGIVEYSSAHLNGAVSEIIVESDHSAHEKPEAIKEIKRILLNHLAISSETH